jgi:hypothetical protein
VLLRSTPECSRTHPNDSGIACCPTPPTQRPKAKRPSQQYGSPNSASHRASVAHVINFDVVSVEELQTHAPKICLERFDFAGRDNGPNIAIRSYEHPITGG